MLPGAKMVQKVWLVSESMKGDQFIALSVLMMLWLFLVSHMG